MHFAFMYICASFFTVGILYSRFPIDTYSLWFFRLSRANILQSIVIYFNCNMKR